MNVTETSARRADDNISPMMFLSAVFTLGLGGLLLLCLIAYAMVTKNLALGLVSALLLFCPYAFGAVWFLTFGTSLIAKRVSQKAREAADELYESH